MTFGEGRNDFFAEQIEKGIPNYSCFLKQEEHVRMAEFVQNTSKGIRSSIMLIVWLIFMLGIPGEGRANSTAIIPPPFSVSDGRDSDKGAYSIPDTLSINTSKSRRNDGLVVAQAETEEVLTDLMGQFDAHADDEDASAGSLDDVLEGFGEDEVPDSESDGTEYEKSNGRSLECSLKFLSTYNFASEAESPWVGFTALRPEIKAALRDRIFENWELKIGFHAFHDFIYGIKGRNEYTQEVLDDYEQQVMLSEAFLQGKLTRQMDLKVGRQIEVWGALDFLRINDVLNPLDLRMPGLTEIEDLRLPVTMAKLDYYIRSLNLSAIVIPESRFSMLPAYGIDYYPYENPSPRKDEPDFDFKNNQYAVSLTGTLSCWDFGLYWADIYDDRTHAEMDYNEIVLRHARIKMIGTSVTRAYGNWLLKGELALFTGLRYSNTAEETFERFDYGAGVEYSGLSDMQVSIEAVNRLTINYRSQLQNYPDELRENKFQWALRINKNYWNETLALTLHAGTYGIKAEDGAFERIEAEYDISDTVSVRGGVVFYQSGEIGVYRNADANDRLFLQIQYSF